MYLPGPSYQAQGGFFDCESFEPQINTLKEVVRGIESAEIEPQILEAKGREMMQLALDMGKELTDKAASMRGKLTNIFVKDQLLLPINDVFDSNVKNIFPIVSNVLNPAKRSGQALVSSAGFQRAIASHVRAVIRGFETLAFLEDIKPGILCALGKVLSIAAKIGDLIVSVGKVISAPFEAAIEAADNLGKAADKGLKTVTMLTIGGGLFLLYWYGLRKK
jgi:hypothetical protein